MSTVLRASRAFLLRSAWLVRIEDWASRLGHEPGVFRWRCACGYRVSSIDGDDFWQCVEIHKVMCEGLP